MDMKTEIAAWVKAARKHAGISQEELGAKLALDLGAERGFSKANISHWETMKHGPSLEQLLAISRITGYALPESITGAAPALDAVAHGIQSGQFMPVDAYNHGGNLNVVQIPRVELRVSAGISGFSVDGSDGGTADSYPLDRRWVERNGFQESKLIAMTVKGDSMFPLYRDGDIIVVNTADTKMVDTKEYVFNFEGDVVLKRLSRDGGMWWLTSENQEQKYHRRSVRSGETIVIGRVVRHDRTDL